MAQFAFDCTAFLAAMVRQQSSAPMPEKPFDREGSAWNPGTICFLKMAAADAAGKDARLHLRNCMGSGK